MRKVKNVIQNVLVGLVVILAIAMMLFTIISVNTFDQNNRSFLGHKFFIVRSDSMSATDFEAGDLVVIKNLDDPSVLKAGDIISYTSEDPNNFGEVVTHKIRETVVTENGDPGFITYGTTTGVDDALVVTYPHVLGKYVGNLPKIGNFFAFLKTTQGYVLCILIPFLLLILYNGINCVVLFKKYRQGQMEELQAEREKLAEERKQSEKMLEELRALKAQLGDPAAENVPASAGKQTDSADDPDIEIIEL